ncbi:MULTISPECIES: HalOD1 output domain-containing protein [unclassified Haladaptatus]|uniref:HalOD1 output domain-containing protein n=1 Tax=unclassified Haladaptatus TaxID=2622732 RepID=UPI002FCE1FC5
MYETLRMNGNEGAFTRPVSELLVEALADWHAVEPHELHVCVFDYVDPEALDSLFRTTRVGGRREGTVTVPLEEVVATIEVTATDAVDISLEPKQADPASGVSSYTGLSD